MSEKQYLFRIESKQLNVVQGVRVCLLDNWTDRFQVNVNFGKANLMYACHTIKY